MLRLVFSEFSLNLIVDGLRTDRHLTTVVRIVVTLEELTDRLILAIVRLQKSLPVRGAAHH